MSGVEYCELSAAASRAESWIAGHFDAAVQDPFSFEGTERQKRLKLVAEIAFLQYAIPQSPPPIIEKRVVPLLVKPAFRADVLNAARHNLKQAHLVLPTLYAACKAFPPNGDFQQDVCVLVDLMLSDGRELTTFREIDYLYNLWRLTGASDIFDRICEVAKRGCLGPNVEGHLFGIIDAYPLTHTIFYLTDFGRLPWPAGLCDLDKIVGLLDMMSHKAELEGNYDLLAEYSISRYCLGSNTKRLKDEISLIRYAQFPCGAWLSPGESIENEQAAKSQEFFFRNYHTTLVCMAAFNFATDKKVFWKNYVDRSAENYTDDKRLAKASERIASPVAIEIGRVFLGLGRGEEICPNTDILIDGLYDPQHCLAALSCCFRLKQFGRGSEKITEAVRELSNLNPAELLDSPRLMRCWALAAEIENTPLSLNSTHLIAALTAKYPLSAFTSSEVSASNIDSLITRVLLSQGRETSFVRCAESDALRTAISTAFLDDNPYVLTSLLPYVSREDRAVRRTSWNYVMSMLPSSLLFCWNRETEDSNITDQFLPQVLESWAVARMPFNSARIPG